MMFLMSSSSSACFGVAGIVGLIGVGVVLAGPQTPRLLSGAGLIPMSLEVAMAGLGTAVVAVDGLSVAVATTVLAKAASSCGVSSSTSPGRELMVCGVASSMGSVDMAGDRGTVAIMAVSVAGGVVGSLPGVGGHPTGASFLVSSRALLLGLRSWSSISRSTVLSPLNSSSAGKYRYGHQPHTDQE